MHSDRKFRKTKQRGMMLEELRKVNSHPTADEVYQMVRKRMPRVSLATVYRNLEVLSKAGMIKKLELAGNQRRYDGITKNHYHVRCTRCGRVDDIPIEPITSIEREASSASEYEIFGHRVEFIGLCPDCRGKVKKGTGSSRNLKEGGRSSYEA